MRPSELLGLHPLAEPENADHVSWLAWCLDEAAELLSSYVDNELEGVEAATPAQTETMKRIKLTRILGMTPKGLFKGPEERRS